MWLTSMDLNKLSRLFFLVFLLVGCTRDPQPVQRIQGLALGTSYSIQYASETLKAEVFEKTVDSLFDVLNQSLSTYLPNSDISKINRGDSTLVVDEHFEKVYNAASWVWELTEGYFDPTVGALVNAYGFGPGKPITNLSDSQRDSLMLFTGWNKTELTPQKTIIKKHPHLYFDFNALAKGYVVDVIANALRAKNCDSFLVEIGGEIVAQGKSPNSGNYWKIAIDDPQQQEERKFIQVLTLQNQAIATSGNYRKYNVDPTTGKRTAHSINPKTGLAFPTAVLSASVVAPDCMTADALATALMVMPLEKSREMLDQLEGIEGYWIISDDEGKLQEVFTSGFPRE